ncbi:MAG TPA: hypothetical protein VF725_00905 [Ktedonobacterales bacterium]
MWIDLMGGRILYRIYWHAERLRQERYVLLVAQPRAHAANIHSFAAVQIQRIGERWPSVPRERQPIHNHWAKWAIHMLWHDGKRKGRAIERLRLARVHDGLVKGRDNHVWLVWGARHLNRVHYLPAEG